MSKKKQGKTAKKRTSAGERIMCNFYPMSLEEIRRQDTNTGTYASHYARMIDRAIRAEVKKERARNVKILTRWQRSAASAGTVIGDHAAECIGACIEEIDQ